MVVLDSGQAEPLWQQQQLCTSRQSFHGTEALAFNYCNGQLHYALRHRMKVYVQQQWHCFSAAALAACQS
jgi:hypothetical protein